MPELQTECRRAARFLRDLMRQLGCIDSHLIPGEEGRNPLVYCRFSPFSHSSVQNRETSSRVADTPASVSHSEQPLNKDTPTVLVYGHYDVMPPGEESSWDSDPFKLTGRGGYLYGRGVTDDKGPVLAILFAVAELHRNNMLDMEIVFCIEGEEEAGSIGLYQAIEKYKPLFGQPKLILLSSSYWLGERIPCLTYGMRGSIRATIEIESSRNADVHSGVWGGAAAEPLTWLSHILSRLSGTDGKVLVPGFEEGVEPVTSEEEKHMRELVHTLLTQEDHPVMIGGVPFSPPQDYNIFHEEKFEDRLYNQLMMRWRFPTLSVHHITVSTSAARGNSTLIPAAARADISMRIVPNQDMYTIANQFQEYVIRLFDELNSQSSSKSSPTINDGINSNSSTNKAKKEDKLQLHLRVNPVATWWLANPDHPFSSAAREAIATEWSLDSGEDSANKSLSSQQLTTKAKSTLNQRGWFDSCCPLAGRGSFGPDTTVINLPMGQSTDINAHMGNERIRLVNLVKGRNIVSRLLQSIGTYFTPKS